MSTQEMTGANKLAARILDDAHADAAAQAEEAGKRISAIQASSERTLAERAEAFAQKRREAVSSVLDGCRTRAALDGRKSTLARKRAVIDAAFARAYEALCELDAASRGEICKDMLLGEAEEGDTVVPAKADRAALERLTSLITDRKLTISSEDAPFDGGFLLVSAGYEKDCSFASLLSQLRDAEEPNVARLLFSIEGGQS